MSQASPLGPASPGLVSGSAALSGWRDGPNCPICGKITRVHPDHRSMCPNCLHLAEAEDSEAAAISSLSGFSSEPPRPLQRLLPPAEPFPADVLPSVLGDAARAVHETTQAPAAIGCQSVLAAAALAVQAHFDVELPHGERRPTSLYLATIAESGERKTSADRRAMRAVEARESILAKQYSKDMHSFDVAVEAWETQRKADMRRAKTLAAKKEALEALGPRPKAPAPSILVTQEPTIEGVQRVYSEGALSLGIFATEGGQFLGGHGMNRDNRLKTAAAMSALWDGEPTRRVRAGDGAHRLAGRRLSMHLQLQPGVAHDLFGDSSLIDQGLCSRILPAAPDSSAGTRFWKEPPHDAESRLDCFADAVAVLLAREPRMAAEQGALSPIPLPMALEARHLWIAFADNVERRLGSGGDLAPIRGLAGKLPEHASRLAAVMAAIIRPNLTELTGEDLARGITLAEYYAAEALRLHHGRAADPELELAARVLGWIRQQGRALVALVDLYQKGPNAVRTARTARRVLGVLAEHGYLAKLPHGAEVSGKHRRDVWEVCEC